MQYRSKLVIEYLRFWSFKKLQDSKGRLDEDEDVPEFWNFKKLQDSKGKGKVSPNL